VVAEEELLDIGIVPFDPGVPSADTDPEAIEELARQGIYPHVRRAESVQMAVQLQESLQRSQQWGGVWITPSPSMAVDLVVEGRILESDGYLVRVHVRAIDVMGRTWIDKEYELTTTFGAYDRGRYPDVDPYRDLFHVIANELAAARRGVPPLQLAEIRTVGALRYAGGLNPPAFEKYVVRDRAGTYAVARLPARDDPMFERTLAVQRRELLFLDTLDLHYKRLSAATSEPYTSWRRNSREESLAMRELIKGARWRAALGAVALMTGALGNGAGAAGALMNNSAMVLGADLLKMRARDLAESQEHKLELEELSNSYDREAEPIVLELSGTVRRLTGAADAQYAEWRRLLQELFLAEAGVESEAAPQ
jgi:hypothetical protein